MVPRKMAATLLAVYVVAMLAEQTEGYISFYSHSDFQRMQEKERNKGQKKSLTLQQRSDEGAAANQERGRLIAPVEIGIRLNSRQLEKYQDVLEELEGWGPGRPPSGGSSTASEQPLRTPSPSLPPKILGGP
uniref:Promotilin n=1 Tax=Sphenodon punctatus TaxID=8508 RepID=A0A8D0H0V2_SPHPU